MSNNTHANFWHNFSADFEKRNQAVIGDATLNRIQSQLAELACLGDTLEVGCGHGTYTRTIAPKCESLIATDMSHAMLSVCRNHLREFDHIKYRQADAFQLPFKANAFDTLFMANVFHVVPNHQLLLAECRRVLRPYGRIVMLSMTQHKMTLLNRIKLNIRYFKHYGRRPKNHRVLTPDYCQQQFALAGLSQFSAKLIGNNTHAILCQGVKT